MGEGGHDKDSSRKGDGRLEGADGWRRRGGGEERREEEGLEKDGSRAFVHGKKRFHQTGGFPKKKKLFV